MILLLQNLEKYIGLVLDNAQNINKVYTTTFPDKEIIKQVIDKDEKDILIFHIMQWDT